jgi:hypothetical protein
MLTYKWVYDFVYWQSVVRLSYKWVYDFVYWQFVVSDSLTVYKVIDPLISQPDNRLPVCKVIDPLISHPDIADNRLPASPRFLCRLTAFIKLLEPLNVVYVCK